MLEDAAGSAGADAHVDGWVASTVSTDAAAPMPAGDTAAGASASGSGSGSGMEVPNSYVSHHKVENNVVIKVIAPYTTGPIVCPVRAPLGRWGFDSNGAAGGGGGGMRPCGVCTRQWSYTDSTGGGGAPNAAFPPVSTTYCSATYCQQRPCPLFSLARRGGDEAGRRDVLPGGRYACHRLVSMRTRVRAFHDPGPDGGGGGAGRVARGATQFNCGRSFTHSTQKALHVRKQHTGERPFACTYDGCSKTFFASGQLKDHTRSHTGEKLAQCPQCNKMLRCAVASRVRVSYLARSSLKFCRLWTPSSGGVVAVVYDGGGSDAWMWCGVHGAGGSV